MSAFAIVVPSKISIFITVTMASAGYIILIDFALAVCCVAIMQFFFFSYGHVYEFVGEVPGIGRHRAVGPIKVWHGALW
jgi:hypothetical protein